MQNDAMQTKAMPIETRIIQTKKLLGQVQSLRCWSTAYLQFFRVGIHHEP